MGKISGLVNAVAVLLTSYLGFVAQGITTLNPLGRSTPAPPPFASSTPWPTDDVHFDLVKTPNTPPKTSRTVPLPPRTSAPRATASRTPSPTPKPVTVTTNSSSSCNYNLTGPTGAFQVRIHPQSGAMTGQAMAELSAQSGCRVLDGRSTDTQKLIGGAGSQIITYSSVPPGSYTVRVNYAGVWSNSVSGTVAAGSPTAVDVSVPGDSASAATMPTPTANPKLVCAPLIAWPSSSGAAPLTVKLCTGPQGYNGSSTAGLSLKWDFLGNNNWTTGDLSCQDYTYQSSGAYYPKVILLDNLGQQSDSCQTAINVH